MSKVKYVCMDYDSMGNHGRFPSKKIKQTNSLKDRLIRLLKRKDK
jgi:hypothetical protein